MLGYTFAKTYPRCGGRKVRRYTTAWAKHRMLSPVPDVSDTAHRSEFAAVGDRRCRWDNFITGPPPPAGLYVMRRSTSAFDVQYYMDGFSLYHCRPANGIGNVVFVKRGECLPVYIHEDCGKSPASKDVSKQHYLLVVGPGGVLVCCAMRSATKLCNETPAAKRKAGGQFEFWYDLIPQLLESGDLGDEDLEEVRCRMAGKRWTVCSQIHGWTPGQILIDRQKGLCCFFTSYPTTCVSSIACRCFVHAW